MALRRGAQDGGKCGDEAPRSVAWRRGWMVGARWGTSQALVQRDRLHRCPWWMLGLWWMWISSDHEDSWFFVENIWLEESCDDISNDAYWCLIMDTAYDWVDYTWQCSWYIFHIYWMVMGLMVMMLHIRKGMIMNQDHDGWWWWYTAWRVFRAWFAFHHSQRWNQTHAMIVGRNLRSAIMINHYHTFISIISHSQANH